MKVAFLHTLLSNQALFTPYIEGLQRKRPDVTISHHVAEELLQNARKIATSDEEAHVRDQVHQEIASIATDVDMVVCTCSTIGDMAEQYSTTRKIPVLRVDRPMAQLAVEGYSSVHVLAALESTLQPTKKLLEDCARNSGVNRFIQMTVVPDAWSHFQRGDRQGYAQTIADYILNIHQDKPSKEEVIVLAQASMSPAEELVKAAIKEQSIDPSLVPRILTSPSICMKYLDSQFKSNADNSWPPQNGSNEPKYVVL